MKLDGKSIKETILEELKLEVSRLDVKPKLVVIQVGNNEASNVYIKQKCNMCNYIGYDFEHIKLDSDVEENIEEITQAQVGAGISAESKSPEGIRLLAVGCAAVFDLAQQF